MLRSFFLISPSKFEPNAYITVGSDCNFIPLFNLFIKTPAIFSFSEPSFSMIDARVMASFKLLYGNSFLLIFHSSSDINFHFF